MEKGCALLVVDLQIDFCEGGALPVPKGELVVRAMNRYIQLFHRLGCPIFASRDWHPADSEHFRIHGGVWPVHCVQNTRGAQFHPELLLPDDAIVISAGMGRTEQGYSSFEGIDGDCRRFSEILHRLRVQKLYVGGLATDYCVKQSVLDALKEGFAVTLLTDAIRGIDLKHGDCDRAIARMVEAGAELAMLESVGAALHVQNNS